MLQELYVAVLTKCGSLVNDGEVESSVQQYLNRLSDYFFTAARFAASHDGESETTYRKEFDRKS